jgi:phosphate acyltransferase
MSMPSKDAAGVAGSSVKSLPAVKGRGLPRVVIDAMGGDEGPEVTVQVAAAASLQGQVSVLLVGDAERLDKLLQQQPHNAEFLSVVHLSAEDGETSPERAAQVLAAGKADAMVTASHPRLVVEAATRHLAKLPHVVTPALAAVLPTARERGERQDPFSLLLDVGAGTHASAEDLVSFALMGAAYARVISKNERPKVALLSNTRDPTRGPEAVVAAHKALLALSESNPHLFDFLGNIAGHQLPTGEADVVVCEGFTGNVVMRLVEGVASAAMGLMRSASEQKLRWRVGLSMLSGGLAQLRQLTDWEQYGGAPLLGLTKPILVTHSNSGVRPFTNALKLAVRTLREDVTGQIQSILAAEMSSALPPAARSKDAPTDDAPQPAPSSPAQPAGDTTGQ